MPKFSEKVLKSAFGQKELTIQSKDKAELTFTTHQKKPIEENCICNLTFMKTHVLFPGYIQQFFILHYSGELDILSSVCSNSTKKMTINDQTNCFNN